MLPLFTTTQVKDGVDVGDYKIDLSDYMKKQDAASKQEIQVLTEALANKLDATPQHKHHIDDIKQLQSSLDSKYDKSEKYSHNVILNDTHTIPYLESPKIEVLEIVENKDSVGYKFYVDDGSGDLFITLDDVLIGSYLKSAAKWNLIGINTEVDDKVDNHETILENHSEALNAVCNATTRNATDIAVNNTKINNLETEFNEYVAKTDAIIKNHYEALLVLVKAHGMIDGDGDGASNITPEKAN